MQFSDGDFSSRRHFEFALLTFSRPHILYGRGALSVSYIKWFFVVGHSVPEDSHINGTFPGRKWECGGTNIKESFRKWPTMKNGNEQSKSQNNCGVLIFFFYDRDVFFDF